MKNKKQMVAVLLSAILGITANSWFVQANSSVIQDDQQEPDNEAPDSDKVTEGTDTYKGFLLDNVLHSSEEGDIHYMFISRIVMMEVSHMLYSLHFQAMKDCTFKA